MPRTKEFNPQEVLSKAMDLFWQKGYEATSVQDLVETMEINRFSLYDTFGDKQQLYLKAHEQYYSQVMEERFDLLENSSSGLQGIKEFFKLVERFLCSDEGQKGCFIVNTATELSLLAPHMKQICQQGADRLTEAFYIALKKAKKDGEISTTHNLRQIAQYFVTVVAGLHVMVKINSDSQEIKNSISTALQILI